jgi:hypothetical protein
MAIAPQEHTDLHLAPTSRVSPRAVLLGLGLVITINLWMPYSEYIVRASRLNLSHFPVAVFILFLGIRYLISPLFLYLKLGQPITPSEQLVIIAMGLAGGVVPGSGVLGFLFGTIATPFYFATPENRWAEFFHAHLPTWLVPPNTNGAMRDFYEGALPGTPIPWAIWIAPLFWWLLFIAAIIFVSACIAVILRRQWSDNERLTFPLLSPTLHLISPTKTSNEPFQYNGLYWTGFGISFGILSWNMLNYFWPIVPSIDLALPFFYFAQGFPPIFPRFNIYVMGFAYFANLDVLFSMWFFHLLFYQIPGGLLNRVGYNMPGRGDPYGALDFSGGGWLCFGAMFFFVFWGLYISRNHLKEVILKALNPNHPIDDSRELLSYRTATLGLLIGSLFIVIWLYQSGMAPIAIALYTLGTFVIYVGVARVVAQTGILFVQAPISAQVFTMYTMGAHALTTPTMTSLALSYALTNYIRGLFMPAFVHIAKLSEWIKTDHRKLLGAVFLGLLVGCFTFILYVIPLGYEHGAFNFNDIPIKSGTDRIYPVILSKIVNPFGTDWQRLGFFGGGMGLMALLTFLQYRFTWWPLHPIGLTVCSTNVARSNQVSIFLVWAFKLLVLRFGGVTAYRRFQPLFIGLLTGYGVGVALSFVVDAIWFIGQGHYVHRW